MTLSFSYNTLEESSVTITGLSGSIWNRVVVPDEIDGRPVTAIGDSAFSGCSALKEVVYTGAQEDWEKIRIARWNEPLHSARRA